MLLDHQKAMQEDQELREEREAAKAAKAGKKKRKSEVADDDVDMDDVDLEEEGETKKSSKKRKKDIESEGDEEKVYCFFLSGSSFADEAYCLAIENSQNCAKTQIDDTEGTWHS